MTSDIDVYQELSPHDITDKDKLTELERLSSLNYTVEEMAIYFDVPLDIFSGLALNENSKINYHIKRGKLVSKAKEKLTLLESAETGNITASQQINNIRRWENFHKSRKNFIYEDEGTYPRLKAYIESGSTTQLDEDEETYLEIMTMMNSMKRKYGERKTIQFFQGPPYNLGTRKSKKIYDNAIQYFYSDMKADKKALRNLYAEMIREGAQVVLHNAQSAKDYEVYTDMLIKAAKLQQLDQVDPPEIPIQAFLKPIKVYTLDPENIGIPGINRDDLAKQIDAIDNVPEPVKRRAKMDSLIIDVEFEEMLNELQEENTTKK